MKVKNILTHALYIHIHRTNDEEEKVNEIRLDYHVGIVCLSFGCYCSFFFVLYLCRFSSLPSQLIIFFDEEQA